MAEAPELARYFLPDGVVLTTTDSVRVLAELLGIPNSTLDARLKAHPNLPRYQRRADQPAAVKVNYQVWEILALVECGELDRPSNVRYAVDAAIS